MPSNDSLLLPIEIPFAVVEKRLCVPVGATGSLHQVFKWTDAVLQLLQVTKDCGNSTC